MKTANKKLTTQISILILTCILFTLCTNQNPTENTTTTTLEQTTNSRPSSMDSPVNISLSVIGTPNLNQTVELVTTAHVLGYPNNFTINITLPEGVEYVSGDNMWKGYIGIGKTQEMRTKIKAVKPGNWTIIAKLSGIIGDGYGTEIAGTNIIFLNETNAVVMDRIPPKLSRDKHPVGTSINPGWITLSLSVLGVPKVNRTVDLVTTIGSPDYPGNFTLNIGLPEGVELVSGDTTWRGNIDKNETKEIKLKLNTAKAGNWNISAQLSCEDRKHPSINYANIPIIIPDSTNATEIEDLLTQ